MYAFDGNACVGAYFELSAVGAVGGTGDDFGIGDRGDRAESRLQGASKEIIEVAPASVGLEICSDVVLFRVLEGLNLPDRLRVIVVSAESVDIVVQPFRQLGFLDADRFWCDGVLEMLNRGLIHDEVENAVA